MGSSSLLGPLVPGAITGTVNMGPFDLTAVNDLLTTPLSDGTVTVNLTEGTISVNLASLLGDSVHGINDLAPNSELVLNAAVLNSLTARVGALLDAWTASVTAALQTAVRAAPLTVDTSIALSLRVLGLPVDVVRLDVDLPTTTVGDVLDGRAALTASTTILREDLLSGLLTGVAALATGLTNDLVAPTKALLSKSLVSPVTTVGSRLAVATVPVVTALAVVIDSLPSLVSLRVNVQPDKPNAPVGPSFVAATGQSSAEYRVSALRVGLLDSVGSVAAVYLATATSGVNTRVR